MILKLSALLIAIGLALMLGSQFVGNSIDVEQEWSEEQQLQFERLAASVHSRAEGQPTTTKRQQLKDMQQQLLDLKEAARRKKRLMSKAGLIVCLLGIGVYLAGRVGTLRR